jgi:hypothetical protein
MMENNNNAKRSNAILRFSATSLQTARIISQKSRLANRIAVAGIVIILFIQGTLLWLFTHNSIDPQKQDHDAPYDFTPPSLKHEPYNISQLPQLWKASQFTGMNSDISQKKIIVVVSHCNKPLHWMQDYIVNGTFFVIARIYIISKCGEQPLGAPEGAVVQAVSNVGREGHTYAYFITEILPQEVGVNSSVAKQQESIVVFLKDTTWKNHGQQLEELRNLETMVRLASSSNGFGCFGSPPKHGSAYHNITMLSQFEIDNYDSGYAPNGNIPFKSSHTDLGAYWLAINATLTQKLVPVCYGGRFAASVENIYKQDMNMWMKLEISLTRGDNIEEGHFVERSWAALLSNPLEPLQIAAIQNYTTEIAGFPMTGMLACGRGWWSDKGRATL